MQSCARSRSGVASARVVNREELNPGPVELKGLASVVIAVLLRHGETRTELFQRFSPFAQKEQAPWQGELTQPIGEAQITVVFTALHQNAEALDCLPAGFAVMGRAPLEKSAVHHVVRHHDAVSVAAYCRERRAALVRVLVIPAACPD